MSVVGSGKSVHVLGSPKHSTSSVKEKRTLLLLLPQSAAMTTCTSVVVKVAATAVETSINGISSNAQSVRSSTVECANPTADSIVPDREEASLAIGRIQLLRRLGLFFSVQLATICHKLLY